jgi:DinB family protein
MTAPLHPRLAELRAELDRARDGLLAAVARMPAEATGLRTTSDQWSVAETVEHLLIVEGGVGRLLGKLGKQAEALGPETSSGSLLASLDRYGLRTPQPRIRAPGPTLPTGTVPVNEGLAGLAESRRKLLELMHRVSGRALGELGAAHPLLGRLTFYEWLLFLAQHEERHTSQIREIVGRLPHHAQSSGH